ncbi:MAG: hypothetical protein GXW98_08670 [Bifidobacterium crudilactis]|uniref:Uncharacterized protein n=1 Tax=Bifidobacterium crudilactis TaxID=327277 RepID=A0A971D074_9BIFI|nr:hypothetical protein [Bifidobacterium crudilactis]
MKRRRRSEQPQRSSRKCIAQCAVRRLGERPNKITALKG